MDEILAFHILGSSLIVSSDNVLFLLWCVQNDMDI